jgi:hypothetical protein
MDAYDISDKIKKYWCAVVPKNSGELHKPKTEVKVIVNTEYGYREVVGVYINDGKIELILEEDK